MSQGTVSQILKRARAEAEGQTVSDLDAEAASEVDSADDPRTAEGTTATPAVGADGGGSGHESGTAGTAQVNAPANDAATPRRTLTTRSRTTAASASSPAAASTSAQSPAPAERTSSAADTAWTDPADQPAAGAGDPGTRSGNPLADRLREATERCAQLVDQKATSDTLSSAVHEVRRALAAIEIDAAKQNSPAAQRPRQAQPSRPSQSASAGAPQPSYTPEPFDPPRREPGVDTGKAAGRVKFFKPEKGFGFIIPDDGGDDIFVGKDTVQAAGIDRLSEGDRVRYTPGPGAKGLEAKTIERIG